MKRRMTKDGVVRTAAQRLPAGIERREFLKASALVAGMGVWMGTSRGVLGVEKQSPNERINVASIGIGGKGDSDSDHAGRHGNMSTLR